MQAVLTFPDLSPELFSVTLFGAEFALRWYALAYIVGIVIAWRLSVAALQCDRLWPADTPPMKPGQVEDLLTWIILGVIFGGRLGSVLFYNPGYYLQNPGDILKIWQGGMAFHGGLLGVVLASWIYAIRHNIPRLSLADLVAHSVAPGLLLGRLANFVNAELWGRSSDLPWAVVFPGAQAQYCPGVEGLCARHPSQLYEAALEGLILGALILWMVWRRGALRKPGLILGIFLAGYGMARFLVEFVRQPDAQFISPGNPLGLALHIDGFGLTMGQILTLPMLALGLWFIWRATREAK
ncbi:MAG: prolipoprotein diacylglyceryl transferase [Paracoccaceae bacterium]